VRTRRSHYEIAFEQHLARRGTPCVAIEDVKHFAKARAGAKIFDYIVYPPGGRAFLVDVKGRKSRIGPAKADCRQKTWVTRADIEGLAVWQDVFGADFVGMFAFAYWLADAPTTPGAGGGALADGASFRLAGRDYSFWLVSAEEYTKHQRPLSESWSTVSIPRAVFRRSADGSKRPGRLPRVDGCGTGRRRELRYAQGLPAFLPSAAMGRTIRLSVRGSTEQDTAPRRLDDWRISL